MIFDSNADALVKAKSPDTSVSIQDTEATSAGAEAGPMAVTLQTFRARER